MQQKRLLIALVLSSTILVAWTYFFPPVKNPQNAQNGGSPSPSPAATAAPSQIANTSPTPSAPIQSANASAAPRRTIVVETPLYAAKFETLGAEPVSWIIKANKNGQPIYSVKGRKQEKHPLELISAD